MTSKKNKFKGKDKAYAKASHIINATITSNEYINI